MRFKGESPASGESTDDTASTVDSRIGGLPSIRAGPSTYDNIAVAVTGIGNEREQVTGHLSFPSTHTTSPSACLSEKSKSSMASTAGAQVQPSEHAKIPSEAMDRSRNMTSAGSEESAPQERECEQLRYHALSPTQADTEIDVTD